MSQQASSRQRAINLCFKLGLILMFMSLLLHLFYPGVLFGYLLMAGSLLYTMSQALVDKNGVDLRTKRLRGIALLAGVLFVAGSYLFIVDQSYWRLVLMIASVLLLYSNTVLLYHKPCNQKDHQAD
ncbi:hypothetical protein [Porphyromonas asaccharolytica]|uniref:Uncharacterized protein n=1 Tax=Porphyromonas asaccharolytica (strain ATCC 25260 / DSM 20707 / BCRC 10618 / CCUG 7834 / JCM 6326 / LMG 13178 / VPI 4198 / B440) TaxID=879243 RepID=F4KK64_PORAD|nr:hypothetical protein [Porphyromonas asaccharolytica]AEE12789.1 hypothetical protein Poras_0846 [Porphyromonas asaccharolytica DSM 20707]